MIGLVAGEIGEMKKKAPSDAGGIYVQADWQIWQHYFWSREVLKSLWLFQKDITDIISACEIFLYVTFIFSIDIVRPEQRYIL